jgi:hypothetical protein
MASGSVLQSFHRGNATAAGYAFIEEVSMANKDKGKKGNKGKKGKKTK